MLQQFPSQLSNKGVLVYLGALILISAVYHNFAMRFIFMVMGLVSVVGFFIGSSFLTNNWKKLNSRLFEMRIFSIAFILRLAWVFFSYFFFISLTGQPFEYGAADSIGYHQEAQWVMTKDWSFIFPYYFGRGGVSDAGYPFYLTVLYKVFGDGLLLPRVLKAIWSSWTCVLIYKLTSRSIDEDAGRMAGIFTMLMPNLIMYCGLHLKETEMLFLTVAFLERTDYMIRSKEYSVVSIILSLLLCASLFLFRTVLGSVAFLSLCTGVLFTSTRVVGFIKKALVTFWIVLALVVVAGGTISAEIERYYVERTENQTQRRNEQTLRGNQWAQYATGAVMAPMMFVLPFSTMVDVDEQYTQQMLHGGNLVRNYMGYFVLVALFVTFFRRKDWRNYLLMGTYTVGYLAILSLSGFANSERFLLPALPGLIFMWSYGVRYLNKRSYKYLGFWVFIVFIMQVAWAYFKLGSRSLF